MNNKIIVLFILLFLLVPVISSAIIVVPDNSFTVVANSEGENALFNFKIQEYAENCWYEDDSDVEHCTHEWYDRENFSLQTENLTSQKKFDYSFVGENRLIEEVPEGFEVSNIHCASDNPEDVFWYQKNSVVFDIKTWSNVVCIFNNKKISDKVPVLIVPGIMGTELEKGGNLLWANISEMAKSFTDDFMDPLAFTESLSPVDADVLFSNVIYEKKVGSIGLFDYTKGLIDEFKAQNYVGGENLFLFPYDWRYGVSGKFSDEKTNVDLLKEKIENVLQQTGTDKIDVIAHSNGGLLVKKYVMDNSTNHKINKAIFVGVPNTGAPKAVKGLVQGDSMGINFAGLGLSDSEMKKISKNMPVSYDLLPSQQYYNNAGSFTKIITEYIMEMTHDEQDLNYNQLKSYLVDDNNLNSSALAQSENLHTEAFDNYDLRTAGIDLYAVDGCKTATMVGFTEKRTINILDQQLISYKSVKLNTGDGTVPIESSTNLPIDQNKKYYTLAIDHGNLLSANGSRQQIVNLIAGSGLAVSGSVVTQDVGKCQLNGKAIVVFSPVDISVIDQNGNKLGLAEDQSVMNQIPGADFEIWGEHKFIYLPTDNGENYSINMQGTGSGTYTIKVQDIVGSEILKTEVFSNLPVTQNLTGQINLLPNQTTLAVKQNENSNTETILPQATITQEQSDDLISPVSKTTLSGTAGQPGFYKSDVAVKILATDDLSGVLAVQYNLDNAGYQKISGGTATFTVAAEGKHTITFFGTDNAGNNEQEKTIEFTIDKTAPEAKIEFDSNAKDLKFSGVDALQVSVVDKDDTITLTDQAGNITEIKLLNKNRKVLRSVLGVKSIKYNGAQAKVNGLATFSWAVDRKGKLIVLSQSVLLKNGYTVLAIYDGKNTKMTGRDSKGLILKKFSGLKIIKVLTSKGNLSWEY